MHDLSTRSKALLTPQNLILTGVLLVMIIAMSLFLPYQVDWEGTFRPAIHEMIRLRSPYNVEIYWNSPWTIVPLIPLALLPVSISRAMMVLASLFSITYITRRLGAPLVSTFAILLSPPFLHGTLNGNIDWLVMLGFFMLPPIGLIFLSMKPQVGIGVAIFWVVEAWREKGLRGVATLVAPITAITLLSFLLYGFWVGRIDQPAGFWWNASLYPASIPVGLALMMAAIRTRDWRYAMAAAPCLSPYVLLHSWIVALVAISAHKYETITAVIGLWILVALRV